MSPYKFQAERQQILDYLNAHPGTIAIELARALGAHKNTIKTRILRMEDLGEIKRKAKVHYSTAASGKRVAQLAYSLFAVVEHAEFVDQARPMIERQAERAKLKPPKAAKPAKPSVQQRVVWNGGSCRNVWGDRPCIGTQGGQGTIGVRPRGVSAMLGE